MSKSATNLCSLALLLAVIAVPVSGASIVLREQAVPSGSVVFLGDIADIASATDEEMHNLATTPLMAAPAPGVQEYLHYAKVLELLEARGIDVSELSFAGARTVEIGKSLPIKAPANSQPVQQLTAVELEPAVVDAVTTHLRETTGHHDWQVEVTLNDSLVRALNKLDSVFTASAGKAPWTGMQKFQISGADGQRPVVVLAKVTRQRNVVVATRRIEQGSLIGAADVEIRLEGANVPTTAVHSVNAAIGKEAVRTIDANSILQESQLRSPLQVQRGETVKVFARTGGITVSTFAVVQQNGAMGDLVHVQTLDKKERFAARVSGWKQLEVLPTGVTTADYEALNRPGTQRPGTVTR